MNDSEHDCQTSKRYILQSIHLERPGYVLRKSKSGSLRPKHILVHCNLDCHYVVTYIESNRPKGWDLLLNCDGAHITRLPGEQEDRLILGLIRGYRMPTAATLLPEVGQRAQPNYY